MSCRRRRRGKNAVALSQASRDKWTKRSALAYTPVSFHCLTLCLNNQTAGNWLFVGGGGRGTFLSAVIKLILSLPAAWKLKSFHRSQVCRSEPSNRHCDCDQLQGSLRQLVFSCCGSVGRQIPAPSTSCQSDLQQSGR